MPKATRLLHLHWYAAAFVGASSMYQLRKRLGAALFCTGAVVAATASAPAALPSDPSSYTFALHHRIVSSSSPETAWVSRGDIHVSGPFPNLTASLVPATASGAGSELQLPPALADSVAQADGEDEWTYEVSVVGKEEAAPRRTVRRPLCALNPPTYGPPLLTDFLLLHLRPSPSPSESPELVGIAWDQARPCRSPAEDPLSPLSHARPDGIAKTLSRVSRWKTSVVAHPVEVVSTPQLPLPPASLAQAFNADGTPKPPPPPEKGFLAKYWMYLLPAVIILLMGGGEDPKQKAQGGGGGATGGSGR